MRSSSRCKMKLLQPATCSLQCALSWRLGWLSSQKRDGHQRTWHTLACYRFFYFHYAVAEDVDRLFWLIFEFMKRSGTVCLVSRCCIIGELSRAVRLSSESSFLFISFGMLWYRCLMTMRYALCFSKWKICGTVTL